MTVDSPTHSGYCSSVLYATLKPEIVCLTGAGGNGGGGGGMQFDPAARASMMDCSLNIALKQPM